MATRQPAGGFHRVSNDEVARWLGDSPGLGRLARGIGRTRSDPDHLEAAYGVPYHLAYLAGAHSAGDVGGEPPADLASIPFYSLCRGLLVSLAGMMPEKAAMLFGLAIERPPPGEEREALYRRFLADDNGLGTRQKVACLLGDPFEEGPSRFRRESLIRLLEQRMLVTRRSLLDRLSMVGDVAVLFAEHRSELAMTPPLTAAEVMATLRAMPSAKRNVQFRLLGSVLDRCGKVEAYFLAKLVMRTLGLRYESEMLARLLAEHLGVEAEAMSHALALADVFEIVDLIERHGPDGLRQIRMQPLVPIRPALAGGSIETLKRFPAWIERKYDGVRLMIHKSTDAAGFVLCGAYSRTRRDYLELIPGLEVAIKQLPARTAIVDGELYGVVATPDGVRPATVYEVWSLIQGEPKRPVRLRYAAFDVLYIDGVDLTSRPLAERRQRLSALVGTIAALPLPVPIRLAEGQSAANHGDVRRLYEHFRAQGYEGIIAKEADGLYRLASRDPGWRKRKPAITLDLVLLAAMLAVTRKENVGMFSSYVIGARGEDDAFEDVGDVAGVDRAKDAEIQQMIARQGLLTGSRIERKSVSGSHSGFELVPAIVVTVRFDGLVRDPASGRLRLRDPKLVAIRADKNAHEADTLAGLEKAYLKQSVG